MVSVIIPVFNKSDLTKRCLDSVYDHSLMLTEVIVIDNASSDDTALILNEFKEKFLLKNIFFQTITNEKNLGFGSACNQGIRIARGECLAILNNDTWLMPGWDQALITAIKKDHFDVVGPFVDERPFSSDMLLRVREYQKFNPLPVSRRHFVPILMFMPKKTVERLTLPGGGIFDERFFVTYEDTDLLVRIREQKMYFGQTSTCYIWHQSMGTRGDASLLKNGYEEEGLIKFIEKWGYDPRPLEHTFFQKMKRRYRKYRAGRGRF